MTCNKTPNYHVLIDPTIIPFFVHFCTLELATEVNKYHDHTQNQIARGVCIFRMKQISK